MSAFKDTITETAYDKLSLEHKAEYVFSHNYDQYSHGPSEFTTIKMYKLKQTREQGEILALQREITEEEFATLSLAQKYRYEVASKSRRTYRKDTKIDQYTYDDLPKELKNDYVICGVMSPSSQKDMYMVLNIYKKKNT